MSFESNTAGEQSRKDTLEEALARAFHAEEAVAEQGKNSKRTRVWKVKIFPFKQF
jgi:hypothetical protein